MHDVFIRNRISGFRFPQEQDKKITRTLDAHLREAHAGSLAAHAGGMTAHAGSVAIHGGGSSQVRRTMEDHRIDLSENASISAEGGGYIFALKEESYCADKETVELLWLDKLV